MSCKHGARCENGNCICPTDCTNGVFEPICANDGNTYKNECELRKFACIKELDLRALFYGQCDDSDDDTNSFRFPEDLGSGDSGVEEWETEVGYPKASVDRTVSHQVREEDSCDKLDCLFGAICKYTNDGIPFCECDFDCDAIEKRGEKRKDVCGSDGRVYGSECVLKEESCKRQINIETREDGFCRTESDYNKSGNGRNPFAVSMIEKESFTDKECFCNKHGSYYACSCNRFGSLREDCDQTTGQCTCKSGVLGTKCTTCPPDRVLTEQGCIHEIVVQPSARKCIDLKCGFGSVCRETGKYSQCVCDFECPDKTPSEAIILAELIIDSGI
ncbi:hypothetical protein B4U79_06854, partial [Dinothrombium tinctorium]